MNEIGTMKSEIDTPALLIDLELMERNISSMSHFLNGKRCKLRAHTKVHRLPIIAHKQLRAGAKGICCQKVAEAEIMESGGIEDIIVTNQIVTPAKISRLVALSKQINVSVPVDDISNAESLSKIATKEGANLGVLVDVHLGSNRCGMEPGEQAVRLARQLSDLKGLKLKGLMGFEGHLSWMEPRDQRRVEIARTEELLVNTKRSIEASGITVEEISAGSTGTYDVTAQNPDITELQAGTYVLMDGKYRKHVPEFDCALTVLSTVISKPSEDRIITDAGLMTMSSANGNPVAVGLPEELEVGMHAENTVLTGKIPHSLGVGDKIEFVPSYLDATVGVHESLYAIRDGKVELVLRNFGRGTSR
jgi:D-serine deaminase-like pyridoxal phosphate-dependent protein